MYAKFIIISTFMRCVQNLSTEAIQEHRKLEYRNWYGSVASALDEENCHVSERGAIYSIIDDENKEIGRAQFVTRIEGNRYTIDAINLCSSELLTNFEPTHDNLKTFHWSQVIADPIMPGEPVSIPSSLSYPPTVSSPSISIDKPASNPNYIPNLPENSAPSPRDSPTLTPFPSPVFLENQDSNSMNSTSNSLDTSLNPATQLSSTLSFAPSLSPAKAYNDQVKIASHEKSEQPEEEEDKMHPGIIGGLLLLVAAIGGAGFATKKLLKNNNNNQEQEDDDLDFSINSEDSKDERPTLIRQASYRDVTRPQRVLTKEIPFRGVPSDIETSLDSSGENNDLLIFDDTSVRTESDVFNLASFLQLDHEMHAKIRDNDLPLENRHADPIPMKSEEPENNQPPKTESFATGGPNVPDLALFLEMGFLDPSFDDDSHNVHDLV